MKFPSFWDVLKKLGISLPDPSRIKETEQQYPQANPLTGRKTRGSQVSSRDLSELAELLEMVMGEAELAEEEGLDDDDYWVPVGETVKISGYEIPGMVYFGEGLKMVRGYGVEPCLLRPNLRVSRKPSDYEKPPTAYSLSYTQMQPENRAAYLRWLAEGRCASQSLQWQYLAVFLRLGAAYVSCAAGSGSGTG
nr:TerB N-terminal domain-containing protein [Kovacikia minuta]